MINALIQNIENQGFGKLLRLGDKEIDIYSHNYKKLSLLLLKNGFTNIYEDKHKGKFSIFFNKQLITFDIVKNYRYISDLFFNIFSAQDINLDNYFGGKNQKLRFDTLRYIFFFRKDKINYFQENFEIIQQNNFYFDFLDKKIFKKSFESFDDVKNFLNKDIMTIFKYLKLQYVLLHYLFCIYRFVRIIFKRIFSNNTFAVLGYDGSGKTTIVEILSREFGVPYFYMGFKRYSERKYYSILNGNNIFKLLRLLCIYIDFLFLYIQIFYCRVRYEFVFFDRYPKNEIYPHTNIAQKAVDFIFFFYPSSKKYFILYNTPEIILSRKKERTETEILHLNDFIDNKLSKNKKVVIIKNDDVDHTSNQILKHIYDY